MRAAVVSALWAPLVEHGTTWCAPNVHAQADWLDADGDPWPIAITEVRPQNCYVVSAAGQYLDYALEETRRLPRGISRTSSAVGLRAIAPLLRRLDPIVVLDALPVSTVLHGVRPLAQWRRALEQARAAFPGLPLVIRSLDVFHSPALLRDASQLGLALLPSRLVFHQDPRLASFWSHRNVKHDCRMAEEQPMESRVLVPTDATDIAALYWQLYGEKHSALNPRFTPQWLAHGMYAGVLTGEGLIHDGRLVAAYLSYSVEDVMTNPVFGYDTTLPQQLGLYRRLSLLTMHAARQREQRIHASSGAPAFKASRGGVATLEYHGVDTRSVRGVRQLAWHTTLRLSAALGPRLLRSAS